MLLELTYLTTLLLALCALYEYNTRFWGERLRAAQISSGLIFGGICIIGMMHPVTISPGVIFDPRSVVLAMAGVFGGPLTTALAAMIAGSYRWYLGGGGALIGTTVIVCSALFGLGFHWGLRRGMVRLCAWHFLLLGLTVHLVNLAWFTRLPTPQVQAVFGELAWSYLLALVPGTVFLGLLLKDLQAQRLAKLELLRSEALRRAITSASPDLLLVMGEDGRYLEVISPEERLLSSRPSELLGKKMADVLPAHDARRFTDFIQNTVTQGTPQLIEYELDTLGGRLVFEGRAQLLDVQVQGQRAVLFVARDITERWQAEQQRKEALARLTRLAQHLPGFLYQFQIHPDGSACFPLATEAITSIYGCAPQDVERDASVVFERLHPDDRAAVEASIETSRAQLSIWNERYRVLHPSRGLIWVEGHASPERLADGSTLWHGYLVDTTESQAQRERLKLSEKVFSSTQEGIMVTDARSLIIEVNEAFSQITGYAKHEVLGRNPSFLRSGRQGPDFYRQMWDDLETRGRWQGEIWNRRKDGEVYAELLSIDAMRNDMGELQNYVAVFKDINQLKQHQTEIDRATYYDRLTNLPNRHMIDNRLQVCMAHAQRRQELVAVCLFDLDNFKQLNDQAGHEIADRFLVKLADRLRSALPLHHTIARVGGDEFVLLLTELGERGEAIKLVEQVLFLVHQPVHVEGQNLQLSASMGVAIFPELQVSSDELLRYADQAMYRAKQRGRNRFEIFEAAEDSASRTRVTLLRDAEAALINGAFELHFQPKLNLHSHQICAVEALIRWRLPDGALRMPGDFIEQISGYPMEITLGDWVIDRALAHYTEWQSQSLALPVSVNVSVDHLLNDNFVAHLQACLERHQITQPQHITIEILETSRIASFDRVRERLLACKTLGVQFSLDDFGTGYSSMTYMRQLPVDELKIDRSFVGTMLTKPEDLSIVKGIVAMGHAFNRTVTAKGVETEAHIHCLRDLDCDIAQGYGVSRPLPAPHILAWTTDWNQRHRNRSHQHVASSVGLT